MQPNANFHDHTQPLLRLNAVRIIVVVFIALGYASTMPVGPGNPELFAHLGLDPSWLGIQVLFFFSGFLAMRSLSRGSTAFEYLRSRTLRNIPSLALFTLIAVLIIYPALGVKTETIGATTVKLGLYFFETVLCVDPGRVLPGLLDDALYMCLIQGAVWTFRWGAIAHICAAIGSQMGVFKNRALLACFAALSIMGYFTVAHIQAKVGFDLLNNISLGLRLSWPFLTGMACYAYRDKLPVSAVGKAVALLIFGGGAVAWNSFLPWTPAIEILLTGFWVYAALLLAMSKTPKLGLLENWPNLALGLYLANWPTSQLILLANPGLSPLELIALSLPISGLIAFVVHELITKRTYQFAGSRQETLSSPPAFSQ